MDPTALPRFEGNAAQALMVILLYATASGKMLEPIGYKKDGTAIYPIAGGDETGDTNAKIDDLTQAIRELGKTRQEANPEGKAADGARYAAALDGSKSVADQLVAAQARLAEIDDAKAKADRKAEVEEAVKAALQSYTAPSFARAIAAGANTAGGQGRRKGSMSGKASPVLDAAFTDYQPGELFEALMAFKGQDTEGIDVERLAWGKAKLAQLGMVYAGVPEFSKATLGATGATGGYVLPNNLVDTVVKPAVQRAVLQNLVTVINGVAVRGVDLPYRMGAPTRMTFQDWGATKENVDESYGSYTSTLGTIARIMDISKQYARFSSGSAEADVLDELTKAAVLAENYYMVAGAGTGSTGVGDPTVGVYTSLAATPTFLGYRGAKTGSASNSTIAGSFAQACVELMEILAGRNRIPDAILVDSTTFFTAIGQGSDTAGFWVSPEGGPTGFTRTASGGLAFWGVPIYYDTNLGVNATTKIAIAAEWSAFKLYRGMEFRIDSSDVAGTRWDKNLIGFRGEEEIGFNAETPVHVGAAQLMTAVIA